MDTFNFIKITYMFENNGWHTAQSWLQIECEFSFFLQQLAALSGIGTVLDVIVVVQLDLFGAPLSGIHGIGKVIPLLHQTVNVIQGLRLTSILRLERVNLDVFDGA